MPSLSQFMSSRCRLLHPETRPTIKGQAGPVRATAQTARRQFASVDQRSGAIRRHHLHESGLQRSVKQAAQRSGITKRVGCHTFSNCFATHLLETNHDIRTVQELLGHSDVATTRIDTHILNRPGISVSSPLDL